jgi:SAM-dependent methyltransferase
VSYDALAGVYGWLVPDELLTPEGSAAAFDGVTGELAPGARVLDCAAGTGTLAVGLALRGFDVVATDASPAMVERIGALAREHGVTVPALPCTWEQLPDQHLGAPFDAVLCVGNSLTHAAGRQGRRAALRAMARLLRDGGLLAVTSRTWERVRAGGSGLRVDDRLVERGGERALIARAWTIPADWEAAHQLDVAVAVIGDDGRVRSEGERLTFWPFTHTTLDGDLRAAGLRPVSSTYAAGVDRYLVTARR